MYIFKDEKWCLAKVYKILDFSQLEIFVITEILI